MKDMDSGTKKRIVFGSLALILCIIIIIIINLKGKSIFIVVNDNGFKYQDSSWADIDLSSQIFGKYKFTVYKGNDNKGKYEINYVNDHWYFFDDNKDSHYFDDGGSLLAYHGNVEVHDINIESLNEEDLSVINNGFQDKNLYINSLDELNTKEKITYDFDNDSELETIYAINNIDNEDEYVYTGLLYKDGNELKSIKFKNTDSEYKDDVELYSLNNVISLNNKSKNYLILTSSKNLDSNSVYNMVYSFSKKGYKLEKGYSERLLKIKLTEKDYFGRTVVIVILLVLGGIAIIYTVVVKKKKNLNEI